MANKLLDVKNLKTYFFLEQGIVRAVDGVSFSLDRGRTLGVVGESGCGKSVTARSILRLLPHPVARIVDGSIVYHIGEEAVELTKLDPLGPKIRGIRGNQISMIFQEPMTSLNPVYTIGDQIIEAIVLHRQVSKQEARQHAIEMLRQVGIPEPERRVDQYQHEFSGGMRQRAMIAMALSCSPNLLIADEPTTALDVTIEAQILELIREIQIEQGMALMIITHDLNVVGEMADRVIVMYMGKVVEETSVDRIFDQPRHPYTQGLLASLPTIGSSARLTSIAGSVPNPYLIPKGCSFAPRCPAAMDLCRQQQPPTFQIDTDTRAACWLYEGAKEVAHG
ncbi:MAG: ABC transporter ATP-binding protein [Caldilineaceae bacterium]|nr:ABC transporter ATP-binding protein [Caldilineaceae bacterium]